MKASIDRIEGTIAVLIPMDDTSLQCTVPVKLLPVGCREGDVLSVRIEKDTKATRAAKEQVKSLIDTLKKRK